MIDYTGAAVALVILVDLVTGQGPPIYNNYLQSQNGYGPPPPPPLYPVGYGHKVELDNKMLDKEYEKAIELGKVEHKQSHFQHNKLWKEHEKFDKKDKKYGEYDEYDKSTPAPGMLSSISGAWSKLQPSANPPEFYTHAQSSLLIFFLYS